MDFNQGLIGAVLTVVVAGGCGHSSPRSTPDQAESRAPAQAPGELPDAGDWRSFYDTARDLDLTRSDVTLSMSTGGTSVYAVVSVSGRPIGAVIPENSATRIPGEIMAFHLSRALGVSHLYQPGVRYFLTGANLQAFRAIVPDTPFVGKKNKEINRKAVLEQIRKQPQGIDTVFKLFGTKPKDYDALVQSNRINEAHVLKGGTGPFAAFLKCQGPRPSATARLTLNGGTGVELELARQLSSIFLIDALTQQWDRFSGGNLQTVTEQGEVRFFAADNGGTWEGTGWTQKFLNIVSRFDPGVADRILEMDRFFREGGEFLGLRSPEEFARAMGVENYPKAMSRFRASLELVAAHVRKHQGCTF